MKGLLLRLIGGIAGLWVAVQIVPAVEFEGSTGLLIFAGSIIGLINFFIKPVINIVAFPLKLLTFGLFGLMVNVALLWVVDILFPELIIVGLWPLVLATIVVWGISFIISLFKFPIRT